AASASDGASFGIVNGLDATASLAAVGSRHARAVPVGGLAVGTIRSAGMADGRIGLRAERERRSTGEGQRSHTRCVCQHVLAPCNLGAIAACVIRSAQEVWRFFGERVLSPVDRMSAFFATTRHGNIRLQISLPTLTRIRIFASRWTPPTY